ncbi:DEAD/DEAH box helicase family protein [Arsenophonus endosymbiont of Crataerina pallida]|uniref:DEAD/DEAH box helicase family protein n=1 Tax=Arsenophonus endosymbiont of Crataerina pallida TaxID=3066235 RepID=UPI0030CB4966
MAKDNLFQQLKPSILGNPLLRAPQREAYAALEAFSALPNKNEREVEIILPVGCGKSGCITLTPFAFKATRTLVVAPGLKIANQLCNDFDPARPDMFYQKCKVLSGIPYPEPVEIRGRTTNRNDLEEADVVLTNIQQLQGENNHWLQELPDDFFDLIVFDEGHHSVASSWITLKEKFPDAYIVNFSATPLRADGQVMSGEVLYSFRFLEQFKKVMLSNLKPWY